MRGDGWPTLFGSSRLNCGCPTLLACFWREDGRTLGDRRHTAPSASKLTVRSCLAHFGAINRNPVKRGFVERPEDWDWSSFRHYATGEEV
jgi:hypothetical protein